jgi:hypothetical protein
MASPITLTDSEKVGFTAELRDAAGVVVPFGAVVPMWSTGDAAVTLSASADGLTVEAVSTVSGDATVTVAATLADSTVLTDTIVVTVTAGVAVTIAIIAGTPEAK